MSVALPSAYGYKQPSPTFQPSLEPGNESKTGYLRPTTSQAATTAKMNMRMRPATMTAAIGNQRKRLGMCHLLFFFFFFSSTTSFEVLFLFYYCLLFLSRVLPSYDNTYPFFMGLALVPVALALLRQPTPLYEVFF